MCGGAGRASLPRRKWLSHQVPNAVLPYVSSPVFFLSICVNRLKYGLVAGREARPAPPNDLPWFDFDVDGHRIHAALPMDKVLEQIAFYQTLGKWCVLLAVVMPDHVHLLVRIGQNHVLSRVVQSWKSYLARQYGIVWQDGFFEHRIRNDAEFAEKASYIRSNPIAKGLCEEGAWPYYFPPYGAAEGGGRLCL